MTLKIAIQKSGRLYDDSVKMLKECGIDMPTGINKLRCDAYNFPLEILFLRDDDIPQYVEDGIADIGIVGENVVFEKNRNVDVVEQLDFAKCRLSIAVPRNDTYESIRCLNNKKIATSYPTLLRAFLDRNNVDAEIHEISGSVEIAPSIGLADAICDLVSSGSTLLMNGLKETEIIFRSEAVLIGTKNLADDKLAILNKLLFRIRAVKKSKRYKYILLNAPNDKIDTICNLIPGMKSPTILPLAKEGWCSLHSVVAEDDFWNIIENLSAAGAEGILVSAIEKMIL
ncbi:MAG: ATP phosphoribosyltransferase [Flavipsychrobacter sp.]|nr:ATP phosphoribosyltransferase [Flavipsychrobacter sp.]